MSNLTDCLSVEECPIDENCVGEQWVAKNQERLAGLVAIIAMGQAAQASHILTELAPTVPPYTNANLRNEAKIRLTVQDNKTTPRTGYPREHRDGFIFEAISWIAARKIHGKLAYMKDPHLSVTSQGLDGLMVELSADKSKIERTTIFEDKCSGNPRGAFTKKVLPEFLDRHRNKRSAEIIAAASVLLRIAGISDGHANQLAAAVTDRKTRRYRAAFAVTDEYDDREKMAELFAGYNRIEDIKADQRLGACLVVPPNLRDWFDKLATMSIEYLDSMEED